MYFGKIYLKVKYRYLFNEINCKRTLIYQIQNMEENIQNYSPTVMFRGTPCILKHANHFVRTSFKSALD